MLPELIIIGNRRVYKGFITVLPLNGRFVFGSNTQGRHGKGAALIAYKHFGAIYGQAFGQQGKSYAIVTKDLTKLKHPSVSKEAIIEQIKKLYYLAELFPRLDYYIAYSGLGTNLNGYSNEEMVKMFNCVEEIPLNIIFEENFNELLFKNN